MIAPYQHVASVEELDAATLAELMAQVKLALRTLHAVMKPDGFNMGINQGKVAGAGFADHMHFHIVPRWNGDTNFMPVIADIKVVPEHLDIVYQNSHRHWHHCETNKKLVIRHAIPLYDIPDLLTTGIDVVISLSMLIYIRLNDWINSYCYATFLFGFLLIDPGAVIQDLRCFQGIDIDVGVICKSFEPRSYITNGLRISQTSSSHCFI